MKIGVRKPNLKKSFKARTTGRVKRAVKSSVNPTYGKKGVGIVNNPQKALYNKMYNKTTVGVAGGLKGSTAKHYLTEDYHHAPVEKIKRPVNKTIYILLALFLGIFGAHHFYAGYTGRGLIYILFSWTCYGLIMGFIQGFLAIFKKTNEQGKILV